MRTTTALAVTVFVVLAGCANVPGAETGLGDASIGDAAMSTGPVPDPDDDVLGWEDGYWYNETVSVTRGDGLNDSEMDAVVARGMARVEYVRQLEFEKPVPVTVISRSEFRSQQENRSTSADKRVFDNAKFEALFMINETTDSIDVQNQNTGSAVGGYYSPSKEEIVIVSENETAPKMNEITLSQELFHALQDQRFGLDTINQSTRELHNAGDGVIEGDGNYVDYLYEQNCDGPWSGACLLPQASGSGGGGGLANIGPYLLKYQPYSDGPGFVRDVHQTGGWDAVNDLYRTPPASTEQVIHPEKYPDDVPTRIRLRDRTGDGWERVTVDGRPNYGSLGEAGVFSMFMYPSYESGGEVQIIPASQFFNYGDDGNLSTIDPLNYDSTPSAGWDGDKLAVYENEETGEVGYVWKFAWDSRRDAREFVDSYEDLLEYRDAEPVDGREGGWRIPESEPFADAFRVTRDGQTVTVVNAPDVDSLSAVHADG